MSFSEQEIEEFRTEALDLLDVAEKSLLALDNGAEFRSSFDAVFRGFHNLKGASGMMELLDLQAHTHELENILMGFKAGPAIPKAYINLFLRGVDAARMLLDGKQVEFIFKVEDPVAPAPTTSSGTPLEVAPENSPVIPEAAINEFTAECEEIVERIAANLQLLEQGKHSKESIDGLYRDVHSLKGSAYLFSFTKLGDIGHAMESSLEGVRNGTHLPSKDLLDALFKSLKTIESLVAKIKQKSSMDDITVTIPDLSKILAVATENLERVAKPVDLAAEVERAPDASATGKERDAEGASSIRVPVSLLDNLMTLMGEMVLVRNQVLQYSNTTEDLEFLSMSKRLNVVTSEIQGEMMKTRMQPIGNVINKFTRVVRDLSQELKKNITLNLSGVETELDKSLLEAIKDPLTHIVRNSCDHGIETPQVRRAAAKPEVGTIRIKAYHEGGQVVIEVADDGKGLNKDVLLRKAIEKSMVAPADASRMTEKEIFNLIFAPGFSTAAKVTNVSGRGVGMDVVRTNIERIGGTVDLSSVAGGGTSIKIKIPLTLAIVPALIVKCGTGTFAIPQVKLEELVRVDQSSAENKIEVLHGAPVYRLRGNILPLVDLNKVLGINKEKEVSYDSSIINIAVLNAEQCSFGVIIDEVQDTADIVVKPLNRLLKSLQVYSGATVLGDGSVALILDVLGISKVAQIGVEKSKESESEKQLQEKARKKSETQDFLLVRLNSPTKHALVLAYVHRLEEFKRKDVEYSGNQPVIRYRNVILPLVSADAQLGYERKNPLRETIPVVVIQRTGTLFGIEVDEIIDTLSTTVETDSALIQHRGIFGNLNTKEELIVVVDPFELISLAFPDTFKEVAQEVQVLQQPTPKPDPNPRATRRILLVEDNVFFRKSIKTVLEGGGYEVLTANDGKEAIEILNGQDSSFDLIVSDIEMPRVDGFQLATLVRQHPSFAKIAMLAISSRADKDYVLKGTRAGFDIYLEKLKPAILLSAVAQLMPKSGRVA